MSSLATIYMCVLSTLYIPVINLFSHCGREYKTVPGFISRFSSGFFRLLLSCFDPDSPGSKSGGFNRSFPASCSEKLLGGFQGWFYKQRERERESERQTERERHSSLMLSQTPATVEGLGFRVLEFRVQGSGVGFIGV